MPNQPRKLPVPRKAIRTLETSTSSSLATWQTIIRPWIEQEASTSNISVNHINDLLLELARTTAALRHLVED